MKNLDVLKRIMLLTMLFMFGVMPVCFADVVSIEHDLAMITIPFVTIIFIILLVALIIALICLCIGKAQKVEKLQTKAKKSSESLLFYLVTVFALWIGLLFVDFFGAITFILIIIALILRIKMKKKKLAYIINLIIPVFILLTYVSAMNPVEDFQSIENLPAGVPSIEGQPAPTEFASPIIDDILEHAFIFFNID